MTKSCFNNQVLKHRRSVELAFQTVGLKGVDKIIQYAVAHPHATLHNFDEALHLK